MTHQNRTPNRAVRCHALPVVLFAPDAVFTGSRHKDGGGGGAVSQALRTICGGLKSTDWAAMWTTCATLRDKRWTFFFYEFGPSSSSCCTLKPPPSSPSSPLPLPRVNAVPFPPEHTLKAYFSTCNASVGNISRYLFFLGGGGGGLLIITSL